MKISVLFIVLLFIGSVSALSGTLLNPSVTYKVNESDIIEHSLNIQNPNEQDILITIVPSQDVKMEIYENNFTLSANESKTVRVDITAKETIKTNIGVVFSEQNQSLGLQQKVILIVKEKPSFIWYIIGAVAIFIIFILLKFILSERRLKDDEKTNSNEFIADDNFAYS